MSLFRDYKKGVTLELTAAVSDPGLLLVGVISIFLCGQFHLMLGSYRPDLSMSGLEAYRVFGMLLRRESRMQNFFAKKSFYFC